MQLKRIRNDSKVTKKYGKPKTALQRLLENPDIEEEIKEKLSQ